MTKFAFYTFILILAVFAVTDNPVFSQDCIEEYQVVAGESLVQKQKITLLK